MKTSKLLEAAGLPYLVFVEPQDFKDYEAHRNPIAQIVILRENNKGIHFVAQSILDFAREHALNYLWMLDDDIQEFGELIEKRTKKTNASVLISAFNLLKQYGSSIYGMNLRQKAWCAKDFIWNRTISNCMLFNVKKCDKINYDPNILIREDYDISLQAIINAYGTLKTSLFYYGVDDMKSGVPGGMTEIYSKSENEIKDIEYLQKKWPGIFSKEWKRNRWDVKINWKAIK